MSSQAPNTSNRGDVKLTADLPYLYPKVRPSRMKVSSFVMDEGVNEFYRLEIVAGLLKTDEIKDLSQSALLTPLVLRIDWGNDNTRTITGRIAEMEYLGAGTLQKKPIDFYRFIVRPNLWFATQLKRTRIFVRTTPLDMLHNIFSEYKGDDPDDPFNLHVDCYIDGKAPTPTTSLGDPNDKFYRLLIHQRDETDADFILRWLERMGWYMTFNCMKDPKELHADRLLYTEETVYIYTRPPARRIDVELYPATDDPDSIGVIRHRNSANPIPKKFIMQDYSPEQPSVTLTGRYPASGGSDATLAATLADEFFDTAKEGNALAEIRYETAQCHARKFHYETNSPDILPGILVQHHMGKERGVDTDLFITSVHHSATSNAAIAETSNAVQTTYNNNFEATAADKPFHPQRTRPWPQIAGTVEGWVLPFEAGAMEAVTNKGRYHVYMKGVHPLAKQADTPGATPPLFMSQGVYSYHVGASHPLHAGTPVVISFRGGNPDRPFIVQAMPNHHDRQEHITNAHNILSHGNGMLIRAEASDLSNSVNIASSLSNVSNRTTTGVGTVEIAGGVTANKATMAASTMGSFQTMIGRSFTSISTAPLGWGCAIGTSLGPSVEVIKNSCSLYKINKSNKDNKDKEGGEKDKVDEKNKADKEEIQKLNLGFFANVSKFTDFINLYLPLVGWNNQTSRMEISTESKGAKITQMASSGLGGVVSDVIPVIVQELATILAACIKSKQQRKTDAANTKLYEELGGELLFDNINDLDEEVWTQHIAPILLFAKILTQMCVSNKLGERGIHISALNSDLRNEAGIGEKIAGGLYNFGLDPTVKAFKSIFDGIKFLVKEKKFSTERKLLYQTNPDLKKCGFDIGLQADGPIHSLSNDNITMVVEAYSSPSIQASPPANVISLILDKPDKFRGVTYTKLFQAATDVTIFAWKALRLYAMDMATMLTGDKASIALEESGFVSLYGKKSVSVASDNHLYLKGGKLTTLQGKGVTIGGTDAGVSIGVFEQGTLSLSNPLIRVGQQRPPESESQSQIAEKMRELVSNEESIALAVDERTEYLQEYNRLDGSIKSLNRKKEVLDSLKKNVRTLHDFRDKKKTLLDEIDAKVKEIKAPNLADTLVLSNNDEKQMITIAKDNIQAVSDNMMSIKVKKSTVEIKPTIINLKADDVVIIKSKKVRLE